MTNNSQSHEFNHFFFPPFFAFLALALPEFCFLLLEDPAPPEPFLPLFADLDIMLHLCEVVLDLPELLLFLQELVPMRKLRE